MRRGGWILLLVAVTGGSACHDRDSARVADKPLPVLPKDTAGKSTLEPGALSTVAAAPVTSWKGPGDKPFEVTVRTVDPVSSTSRKFGTITLRTALRSRAPDIGQFPCTSCHLGRAIVMADERVKDAHQNIKPVHPKQVGASCSTCHAPDNVEMLALKSGERASLDHTCWPGAGATGCPGARVIVLTASSVPIERTSAG